MGMEEERGTEEMTNGDRRPEMGGMDGLTEGIDEWMYGGMDGWVRIIGGSINRRFGRRKRGEM